MNSRLRTLSVFLLLASYAATGVVGHLELLNHLFLSRTLPAISKSKSPQSKDGGPFWTQQRHIPTTFRVVIPNPDAVETPLIEPPIVTWFVRVPSDIPFSTVTLTPGEPTRAPPRW